MVKKKRARDGQELLGGSLMPPLTPAVHAHAGTANRALAPGCSLAMGCGLVPDCEVAPNGSSPPEYIAGIDEAGRGCLAGPVVAAAVILPREYDLPKLTDSKALRPAERDRLALAIRAQAVAWGLGVVWQGVIDRINILQATFHAMSRAVQSLRQRPAGAPSQPVVVHALRIDGNKIIPPAVLHRYTNDIPQTAIVDGDALEPCISAASILAKTYRDSLLEHLHKRYPVYNFAKHKGYGTKEHRTALREHGVCPLHRHTFGGVKELLPAPDGAALPDVPHPARQLTLLPQSAPKECA